MLHQVPKALHELLGREAPDVGIEAVGVHYVKSMLHKVGSLFSSLPLQILQGLGFYKV